MQFLQPSVLHSRMIMNFDTIRINWEWLMMLIVYFFVILVYQSLYVCMVVTFAKMAISG